MSVLICLPQVTWTALSTVAVATLSRTKFRHSLGVQAIQWIMAACIPVAYCAGYIPPPPPPRATSPPDLLICCPPVNKYGCNPFSAGTRPWLPMERDVHMHARAALCNTLRQHVHSYTRTLPGSCARGHHTHPRKYAHTRTCLPTHS